MTVSRKLKTFLAIPTVTLLGVAGWTVLAPATAAEFQGLGDLPGGPFWSNAFGVSDDGQTVLGNSKDGSPGWQAVRWTADTGIEALGALPGGVDNWRQAWASTSDGSIIVGESGGQAFVWDEDNGMTSLAGPRGFATGISNDGTVIVGHAPNVKAYRWTQETGAVGLGALPDHSGVTFPLDVSGDGSVVVGYGGEPFRWTEETGMVGLGEFGKDQIEDSRAWGVSDDGAVVVGRGFDENGVLQAFRWTAEDGMQGLGFVPGGGTHDSAARAASSDGRGVISVRR